MKKSLTLAAATALIALGLTTPAYASDSVVCGSASAGWNAPEGAVVGTSSASGVVTSILGQLNETYSHVMLSHGLQSGHVKMSHASMVTPRAMAYNTGSDDWYLPDITMADPGAETVGMAAAYAYMYQQSEGPIATAVYADGGTTGVAASQAVLALPLCSAVTSGKCRFAIVDSTCVDQCSVNASNRLKYGDSATYVPSGTAAEGRYLIGFKEAATGTIYRMSYGVYTFTNGYSIPSGLQQSAPYAGINCSLFMSMTANWGAGTVIPQYTYTGTPLANATQNLYNVLTQFVSSAGGNATTQARLANQMTNCFTSAAKCTDMTATPWTTFKTSGAATTISPDRILGVGTAHSGSANTSPWKGTKTTIQWNAAGGNVYGCWGAAHRSDQEYATQGWNSVTPVSSTCSPACTGGQVCQSSVCVTPTTCTPVCNDLCGQSNGCGGTCAATDASACGKCGNAACGTTTCGSINQSNLGVAASAWKTFTVVGTNITATLSGGTGDGDLYVKLGSEPTTSTYDCRSWSTGNSESCSVTGTGTWYVTVRGYSASAGMTLNATVASCSGACVPTCGTALCGQSNGCGGTCANTDATACGKCGNAACCTPTCTGNLCGQSNGCGGTCANTDATSCGKCGNASCSTGGTCGAIAFTVSASTNSCTYTNTATKYDTVNLTAGTAYTFSTCASDADTFLKLYEGTTLRASNDDGCPTGYGSKFTFTPTVTKAYDLYMGFYSSKTGSSNVAITPAASSCTVVR